MTIGRKAGWAAGLVWWRVNTLSLARNGGPIPVFSVLVTIRTELSRWDLFMKCCYSIPESDPRVPTFPMLGQFSEQ
jgi:hypothetical protein